MRSTTGTAVVFSFLLFACGNSSPGQDLNGEWYFVDIRNASFPPDAMTPPLFDSVEIQPPDTIVLHDSLRKRTFQGTYTLHEGVLQWTFQPEDTPTPVEHAVHFSSRADGSLFLRGAAAKHSQEASVDWVFVRPDRLLPNSTVSGDWIIPSKSGDPSRHWILRPDGMLGHEPSESEQNSFWGIYRVWHNANEITVTTLMWVQGEGAFTMFQRVEPRGDTMEVTSRVPPGIRQIPPESWTRADQAGAIQ